MEAFAAESGGMPQLNPEFWVSQIFWLIITFGILYVVLSKLILPKISANLETRKSQILENIEAAEKKREESEQKIEEYEKIVHDSKNEAKNYFKQAREKVLKDIGVKNDRFDGCQLDFGMSGLMSFKFSFNLIYPFWVFVDNNFRIWKCPTYFSLHMVCNLMCFIKRHFTIEF